MRSGDESAGCYERLSETLASLVAQAEHLSFSRCPYRNRYDECTAPFGCRNQRRAADPGALPCCFEGGRLNQQRA